MGLSKTHEDRIYASVLADGLIHVEVPEGTDGAVKREYETSDGKTGTKFEHIYDEVSGKISSISFFDGDFGKSLQITFTDGTSKPILLSLSTAGSYGEDVMKKLPNIDIAQSVTFKPYSFTDDKGKKKKGITVLQQDIKLANYYYDAEKKENVHNFPAPPKPKKGKVLSTDEWKLYFMNVRMFLIEETEERFAMLLTATEVAKAADPEIAFEDF